MMTKDLSYIHAPSFLIFLLLWLNIRIWVWGVLGIFFSQESCKGCSACLILLICCWCLQFFQVFSSLSSFQTYLSCLHLQKHGGTSHYICNLFSVCSILSLLPIEHMNSFPPCQASVHMYIFAFVAVSQWYLYFRTSFVLCLMGSEECESQWKLACFFFFFLLITLGYFYWLSCATAQDINVYGKSFVAVCCQPSERKYGFAISCYLKDAQAVYSWQDSDIRLWTRMGKEAHIDQQKLVRQNCSVIECLFVL